jgi:hypothetical protein
MSDRRLDPTPSTVKRLFATSSNRCAYPGCETPIFDQRHDVVLGEVAHIHGPTHESPRWSAELSNQDCRSANNLVLLCPTHHSLVDQAASDFSADALRAMKTQHERLAAISETVSAAIGERFLQKYRDIQHKVQYAIAFTSDFGRFKPGGTPIRFYPDGTTLPMPPEEAERFMTMRELAIEIGTSPAIPPALSTRTDAASTANRTVKILQLMLMYPDATFDELLQHAVNRIPKNDAK